MLSSGEERSLYLLNIIFEVEARKKDSQETLFIIDDIADSFDYKNKYAIIEYLKEMSEQDDFYQVILTHNFDFFRTIKGRLNLSRSDCCLMAEKTKGTIRFVRAEYLRPFQSLMGGLADDKKFVASIPFARNIIEYTKLTSVLHQKSDSNLITKKDIKTIYQGTFSNNPTQNISDEGKGIVELIFELADNCLDDPEGINFENKILLSLAIRLKAEQYILGRITDKSEVSKNQTRELFDRFKREFGSSEPRKVETLDQVNLMTPENIHLNSFMYEPILDMSDEHLRRLYRDINDL